jgi:hypothetical protein
VRPPWDGWDDVVLKRRTAVAVGLTLLGTAVMAWFDGPLRTEASPLGVVSLELAGSAEAVTRMFDSWDREARASALWSLRVDFVFLLLYAAAISTASALAARARYRGRPRMVRLGRGLSGAIWLAAACDVLENVALGSMMFDAVAETPARIAFGFASVKFAILAVAVPYVLAAPWVRPTTPAGAPLD